jgi:hypothetical protein
MLQHLSPEIRECLSCAEECKRLAEGAWTIVENSNRAGDYVDRIRALIKKSVS